MLCDAIVRSPLSGSGPAVLGAQLIIWVALRRAEQQKSSKYSDVVVPGICKLLTLAIETGGHNNGTVKDLIDKLSIYKARYVPLVLHRSVLPGVTVGHRCWSSASSKT